MIVKAIVNIDIFHFYGCGISVKKVSYRTEIKIMYVQILFYYVPVRYGTYIRKRDIRRETKYSSTSRAQNTHEFPINILWCTVQ